MNNKETFDLKTFFMLMGIILLLGVLAFNRLAFPLSDAMNIALCALAAGILAAGILAGGRERS